MEVNSQKIESVVVFSIKGRSDASNASKLETACDKLIERNETKILLDCSQLDYISSAGLRVLLKLAKYLKKVSGKIAVAHPNEDVQQMFDISGFTELFQSFDNVVDGLTYLQKQ